MKIILTASLTGLFLIGCTQAQPPGGGQSPTADSFIARMMAMDANHDGKLTREEVTDDRLLRMFDGADVNKDGSVTKEELTAYFAKHSADFPAGQGGQGGPAGGFGGGPGRGPGGRGPGMRGKPGEVLPAGMQDQLNLTAKQKKAIEELQHDVDAKLDKILTGDQKTQLKEMGQRGPGGPGGPGGPPRQ